MATSAAQLRSPPEREKRRIGLRPGPSLLIPRYASVIEAVKRRCVTGEIYRRNIVGKDGPKPDKGGESARAAAAQPTPVELILRVSVSPGLIGVMLLDEGDHS